MTDRRITELQRSPSAFPGREVYLPDATVFARNVKTNADTDTVQTDLSGRFTVWAKTPGVYRVCWKANGFVSDCSSRTISVGPSHAYAGTQHLRAESRQDTTVVFGNVRLRDGSIPRTLEPMVNLNAFANVSLIDSSGTTTFKTLVNNFGGYVIPLVPIRQDITLRASTATFGSDLSIRREANLAGAAFHKIDLVIGNTPPRIEPLAAMSTVGRRVKVAVPGSTVRLNAAARDVEGDPIKFVWNASAGSGTLSAATGASVTWKLPQQPGIYTATVIADDGKGGITRSRLSLRTDSRGIPFTGRVTELGNSPARSVRVEVNGRVTMTNTNGEFRLFVPDANRFVLNLKKQGFALISRIFDDAVLGGQWTLIPSTVRKANPALTIRVVDERTPRHCPGQLAAGLDWRRFPKLQPQYQDGKGNVVRPPLKANVVMPPRDPRPTGQNSCGPGLQVEIPPNSLVDSSGNAPSGNVQVAVSTVDLNSPDQMPGDFTVALPSGGTRVMQSYGAGTIEAFSGNRPLNLKAGATATIRIPVDPSQLATGAAIPPTIPMLTYDERRGVWTEDGVLKRSGNFYEGEVRHFSAFNADLIKTNQSCIRVESSALPANYKLEYTIPQTGGAAPVVRSVDVTNASPSLHAIYNLPSNTNITLVPIDQATTVPFGIFIVNTGGAQNPTNPNQPVYPYTACSTEVTLSSQTLPNVPNNGEFLHGLFSFEATNLDELNAADPTQAALKAALDAASVNYYAQIDPRQKRLTFTDFKNANQFPGGELRAVYANSTDLGFGRDMHCKKTGSDVACYVTNYGSIDTADSADVADAIAGTGAVATVAMEYSRIESPPGNPVEFDDATRHVKFYVYDGAGALIRSANLDGLGARPVPQLCMVCHGGVYPVPPLPGGAPIFNDRESVKMGAQFLPFDLNGYTFAVSPFDKASQQAVFKQLNETIVKDTPPESVPVIADLITQWYISGPTQNENVIVSGWDDTAAEQTFYREVMGKTCRTCHVTNPTASLRFDTSTQVRDILGSAEVRVCIDHVMPHAKVTHDKFWKSVAPNMVAQFQAYGEAFKTPINGWSGDQCGPFTPGGVTPASFFNDEVQPVFTANCLTCHVGASPPAGLNLSAAASYGELVNVASSQVPTMNRVTPNSTANSYLLHKLNDTQGTVGGSGSQMPQGALPLSAADIGKIQTWINSGALP